MDYYKILEIPKEAGETDIKKAYRCLSPKYHPDANPGNAQAEKRFMEISEAYSVLGDNKISRRNHGIIVFDSKKKETVLLPGDSNGIVYLNDTAVYTPMVLSPYDIIEMGESKFVFYSFLRRKFHVGRIG